MAQALCEPFDLVSGTRVFDPTMGEGALLLAAEEGGAGNSVELMGCDLDPLTVKGVQERHPGWRVGRADIYSKASRVSSPVWRTARQGVDLVVLNPPFSYRGKQRRTISLLGSSYRATPAVAALAIVLDEVKTSQGVGVVLPEGSFHGEINEEVWQGIHANFDVDLVQKLPRGSFRNAKASSVLLTIRGRDKSLRTVIPPATRLGGTSYSRACRCVDVIRGRIHNSRLWEHPDAGARFVHTSNLLNGRISRVERFQSPQLATRGPMVLLPRVGRFYPEKVVMVESEELVLSDCVIALRVKEPSNLSALKSTLLHPATGLSRQYSGTGAPYITVRDVMALLESAGLNPRHITNLEDSFTCLCGAEFATSQSAS